MLTSTDTPREFKKVMQIHSTWIIFSLIDNEPALAGYYFYVQVANKILIFGFINIF